MDEMAPCPDCDGSGTCPDFGECLLCAGHGTVTHSLRTLVLRLRSGEIRCCPRCGGDGCKNCDKGYIPTRPGLSRPPSHQ